jgi:hypothetical protein
LAVSSVIEVLEQQLGSNYNGSEAGKAIMDLAIKATLLGDTQELDLFLGGRRFLVKFEPSGKAIGLSEVKSLWGGD